MAFTTFYSKPTFDWGDFAMTTKEAFKLLGIEMPRCRDGWISAQRRWKFLLVSARRSERLDACIALSQCKKAIRRANYCGVCNVRIQPGSAHCRMHRVYGRRLIANL